jgi:hypothetical protein
MSGRLEFLWSEVKNGATALIEALVTVSSEAKEYLSAASHGSHLLQDRLWAPVL